MTASAPLARHGRHMEGESTVFNTTTVDSALAGDELLIGTNLDADSTPLATSDYATGICSGGDGAESTVAKLCNFLVHEGVASFVATLDIGGTTIEAASGTCAPRAPCTAIPCGTDVEVHLLDGSDEIASYTWDISAGSDMLFTATTDDAGDPSSMGCPTRASAARSRLG